MLITFNDKVDVVIDKVLARWDHTLTNVPQSSPLLSHDPWRRFDQRLKHSDTLDPEFRCHPRRIPPGRRGGRATPLLVGPTILASWHFRGQLREFHAFY